MGLALVLGRPSPPLGVELRECSLPGSRELEPQDLRRPVPRGKQGSRSRGAALIFLIPLPSFGVVTSVGSGSVRIASAHCERARYQQRYSASVAWRRCRPLDPDIRFALEFTGPDTPNGRDWLTCGDLPASVAPSAITAVWGWPTSPKRLRGSLLSRRHRRARLGHLQGDAIRDRRSARWLDGGLPPARRAQRRTRRSGGPARRHLAPRKLGPAIRPPASQAARPEDRSR